MGELRQFLVVQVKKIGLLYYVVPTTEGNLMGASSLGVNSRQSFMEVLCSTYGVKVKAVGLKFLSSSFLDLFPVSTCFEMVSDGDKLCTAVDCYAMEGLPSSLAAAVATLSPKKKGTFSNQGMKRLLGQVQSELDWVLAGLVSKPKRRCKRVGILGLAVTSFGRNTGSVHEASSGHDLEPGFEQSLGHILDPGLDLVLDMDNGSKSTWVDG